MSWFGSHIPGFKLRLIKKSALHKNGLDYNELNSEFFWQTVSWELNSDFVNQKKKTKKKHAGIGIRRGRRSEGNTNNFMK